MRIASLVLLTLWIAGCTSPDPPRPAPSQSGNAARKTKAPSPYDAAFWQIWGDGFAEVAAYDLTMPKYNQQRTGTAIAITVSEPFSNSLRVKADDGKHAPADVFPAMKLNLIREYQTGVYNYRDMLSAFVGLDEFDGLAPGMAAKVTFSSQEWCGHIWSQLTFGPDSIRQTAHSYFDGEADRQRSLSAERDGISEDALFLAARRIAWPRLRLGQTYTVPVLTSLETERAKHVGLEWKKVELSLGKDRETTVVPAGSYRTNRFTAKWPDGLTKTFHVEADSPNRVVKWESSAGEKAEMIGVDRIKYWQMNAEGGEQALAKLGLTRRAKRMP